jgi:hypothetical protein
LLQVQVDEERVVRMGWEERWNEGGHEEGEVGDG